MDELMAKENTNIRSAKEVAVDHFMKCKHKERETTVNLVDSRMDSNNCSITWTLSLPRPPSIEEGKTFVDIEVKFRMLFRQKEPRHGLKGDRIEMQSKEGLCSKVLKTWMELEEKLLSDVPPDAWEKLHFV